MRADSLRRKMPVSPMFTKLMGPAHAPGTDGFAGLVRILIAQQVSTAAATAIQSRVDAQVPDMTPQAWLAADDATLAACGVSAPKRRYLSGLAQAVWMGTYCFPRCTAPKMTLHMRC